ncbi:DUF2793 domain-containing protein [Aquibium microcysteis]|uniref:DUF2793 domain-containing protein n=1 Tax=Aquibium microcysteis TaxID=675281 RepID=UPI00165D22CA|nr:DUF2793 domain-containing protein [Aquibium microcysteis]
MTTESTSLLHLPYIMPSQAQKHVTHNEALRRLDALVQIGVESRAQAAPPAPAAEGARYIVPAEPGGAWGGPAGAIAARQDGAWAFYPAAEGWLAYVRDEALLLVRRDGAWHPAVNIEETPRLGIATAADDTNRLAVSAAATLLSHAGGGHQLKINKNAAGDTAALLFQTGWSGRAELGLPGGDDFTLKVSSDGSAWTEAMRVDRASGAVSFPATGPAGVVKAADSVAWTGAHSFAQPVKLGASTTPNVPLTVSGSVGGSDGAFHVYNTLSAAYVGCFQAYAPNLIGGQQAYCTIGKVASLYNRAAFAYTHVADGSAANRFSIGFFGADNLFNVQAGGNVGIGTTAPTARLHVAGTVRIGTFTIAGLPGAAAAGAGALAYVSDAAGGPALACSDGASWRVLAALGAPVI